MSVSKRMNKYILGLYLCNEILLNNKKNTLLIYAKMWMTLKNIMLSKRSQIQNKYILYDSIFMKF